MPVDSKHPDYDHALPKWERCRHTIAGSDQVKAMSTLYLPRLAEQTPEEYQAYKLRALWYGASGRTWQGLQGAVMRKDPTVTAPQKLQPVVDDATLTGISLQEFAKTVLGEVLEVGRVGLLVDMPRESDAPRPYVAMYAAESIVNWRTELRKGMPTLALVVLKESVESPKDDDPFKCESLEAYRVLSLDEDGHYVVELYRLEYGQWKVTEKITPVYRGNEFDYIPFCFVGPAGLTPEVQKPPLLDLVDVNLSHYRSSADLEHGRHFCGLPTPWVAGFPEKTTLKIGAAIAWVASDANAKAGMLEFTGQGLGALERALESKEKLMAVLGARMLEGQKRTVEAAETHAIRLAGEQSALRSIASTVSMGLSKCLEWAGLWLGIEDASTATCTLNHDFLEASMSFAELESLVKAWQAGGMSWETYYHNLQQGELTRPGVDAETERSLIEVQDPSFAAPTPLRRVQ
jgi:hypothetical protein